MANDELKKFPRGQLSFGAGDLTQVTNVDVDATNGAKVKHSLKRNPSGIVIGNKEVTVTFDSEIDEDGMERDYYLRWESGETVNLRLKVPQLTKAFVGVISNVKASGPLDDAVKVSVTAVGKFPR